MTIRVLLATTLLGPSLMLAACAGKPQAEVEIMGVTWVADNIGGAPALAGSDVTLTFNPDGRSGGKAGCNTYGAGYSRKGNALTFEQAMSTQMFCSPDALMAQEHAYLDSLAQVTGFERTGDKLKLNLPNGKAILFHAKQ